MRAETGVGPSMASGSQIWRGSMADLPMPPMNISTSAHVSTEPPMKTGAALEAKMLLICSEVAMLTANTFDESATALDVRSVKLNVPV